MPTLSSADSPSLAIVLLTELPLSARWLMDFGWLAKRVARNCALPLALPHPAPPPRPPKKEALTFFKTHSSLGWPSSFIFFIFNSHPPFSLFASLSPICVSFASKKQLNALLHSQIPYATPLFIHYGVHCLVLRQSWFASGRRRSRSREHMWMSHGSVGRESGRCFSLWIACVSQVYVKLKLSILWAFQCLKMKNRNLMYCAYWYKLS